MKIEKTKADYLLFGLRPKLNQMPHLKIGYGEAFYLRKNKFTLDLNPFGNKNLTEILDFKVEDSGTSALVMEDGQKSRRFIKNVYKCSADFARFIGQYTENQLILSKETDDINIKIEKNNFVLLLEKKLANYRLVLYSLKEYGNTFRFVYPSYSNRVKFNEVKLEDNNLIISFDNMDDSFLDKEFVKDNQVIWPIQIQEELREVFELLIKQGFALNRVPVLGLGQEE